MENCDIILPIWNQKKITENCINRIYACTEYPFRLIVIDNASDGETANYLKKEQRNSKHPFILIKNEENIGFVKAVNQGFEESTAPYVCVLNNDTLVCENWLGEMVSLFSKNPDIGIINPSSNVLGQHAGLNKLEAFAESLISEKGLHQSMDYCRGFCMLIRRKVIERIGYFDEVFHAGYFEEADFCKKAQKEGFLSVRAKAAYVYHIDKESFKHRKDRSDIFERNKIIFYKRWGKPVWVSFVIEDFEAKTFAETLNLILNKGHKVILFYNDDAVLRGIEDHINLRFKSIKKIFNLSVLYKIIERRRSKKIKAIFTDDKFYNFFIATKLLHKAEVYRRSEKDLLVDFCSSISNDITYITKED